MGNLNKEKKIISLYIVSIYLILIPKVCKANPDSIVVLVHGMVTTGESSYKEFYEFSKKHLGNVWIVPFEWGTEKTGSRQVGHRATSVNGLSDKGGWVAVAKLKETIARCHEVAGGHSKVVLISHSQGTVVSLAALQEGAKVHNWILMGSPLKPDHITNGGSPKDTTLLVEASKNVSGKIVNLHSIKDQVAKNVRGIGAFGLPAKIHKIKEKFKKGQLKNIFDVSVQNATHSVGEDAWWKFNWLLPGESSRFSGPLKGSEIREILHLGGVKKKKSKIAANFKQIVTFAKSGTRSGEWAFYGDGDHDAKTLTFTLLPGMTTGIHFDDKDRAEFSVQSLKGKINFKILHATNSSWDHESKTYSLSSGQVKTGSYKSPNKISDATLYIEIKNVGSGIAKVKSKFEAWDD